MAWHLPGSGASSSHNQARGPGMARDGFSTYCTQTPAPQYGDLAARPYAIRQVAEKVVGTNAEHSVQQEMRTVLEGLA